MSEQPAGRIHPLKSRLIRYLFSPKVVGFLILEDAVAGLATVCINYLCQTHHRQSLQSAEVRPHLLSGAYRLHNSASATWIKLVLLYVRLAKDNTVPDELTSALETLSCERTKGSSMDTVEPISASNLHRFKSLSPTIVDMVSRAAEFQQLSKTENFQVNDGRCLNIHYFVIETNPCSIFLDEPRPSNSI